MLSEAELLSAAGKLCESANRAAPLALKPLAGGRNNRVFRVETTAGEPPLLKCYSKDPRDPRDRQGAEWAFLNHVWKSGIKTMPQPLAQDKVAKLTLMSLLPGRKLGVEEIAQDHIDQAADFILAVNEDGAKNGFQPASEACFSLDDHLKTIERRVERLKKLDTQAPLHAQAEQFVHARVQPEWAKLRDALHSRFTAEERARVLPLDRQIVSPSDFGFHNALADNEGRLSFFDFEYAGRDDSVKLVCDLFCCPDLQAPLRFRQGFVEKLAAGLKKDAQFHKRCETLLDAYRIKWTCIILNDFLPVDEARRQFANIEARAKRCERQLEKAARKLDEIGLKE